MPWIALGVSGISATVPGGYVMVSSWCHRLYMPPPPMLYGNVVVPGGVGSARLMPTTCWSSIDFKSARNEVSLDRWGYAGRREHSSSLVTLTGSRQAMACLHVSLGAMGTSMGVQASLRTGLGHRSMGRTMVAAC